MGLIDRLLGSREKVVYIGVGGAGVAAINDLSKRRVRGQLIAIDTDESILEMLGENVEVVLAGKRTGKDYGSNGDAALAQSLILDEGTKITDLLLKNDADTAVIISAVGGGTGTGGTPIVADLCREFGKNVITLIIAPFAIEKARIKKAKEGIREIQKASDVSYIFENDQMVSANEAMSETLVKANRLIADKALKEMRIS
ncbi:Cell division protein FtsZ 1 [Candidatus Gugararchaeum adminiculabundum]|nr:Cell division protein FtsZ 1 [Candidatus Gugararchaeum adminiculabundum]